jgi:putative peptide zinc metalloprotease protein
VEGDPAPFDLVLADGTRVPLADEVTIGRGAGNALRLDDPSVSRRHARISAGVRGPVLQDVGSTYGTWLDGNRLDGARAPLRDGSRIRVGDQELRVDRRRTDAEAGRTVVVPPGASLLLTGTNTSPTLEGATSRVGLRPRLRSGYALKRLEATEGEYRWVLRDLRNKKFLRLSDDDAQLLGLLDGRRSLQDLLEAAEERIGASAPPRLARLLTELEERGLLAGEGAAQTREPTVPPNRLQRLFTPHQMSWSGAGGLFERLNRRGGWLLFTRPALLIFAAIAVPGIGVYAALVVGRYGTPFVVAQKLGLGGLVFLLGRFAIVSLHELAHGLALASMGRRAGAVGLKLMLVFPYAYVDTSEAWFEPRRRRIVVSAAGPVSDLTLAGMFSFVCLSLQAGTVRDIFFQLALGAYIGAVFNLNPFIERDGYQILVDVLGVPGLRRRARAQLSRRLRGESSGSDSRVLARYSLYGLGWTVLAACFAAGMSLRYAPALEAVVPGTVAWAALAALWLALLTPALVALGPPLLGRLRERTSRSSNAR